MQQHADSYYAASIKYPLSFPPLEDDLDVDVCIVGAGITGASAALVLAERGYKVAVLEGKLTGWGASGRSGGQMIFGYACDQAKLTRLVGMEASRALWDISLEAMTLMRRRIHEHAIDCDLADGHLHAAVKPRHMTELESWARDLRRDFGYDKLEPWSRERVRQQLDTEAYLGGLYDPASGHVHPLNYTLGLVKAAVAAGARFFEHSPVTRIERGATPVAHTPTGKVRSRHLLLCGNAYLEGVAPEIERKIMPVGTYITATEPLGEERARELIRNNMAVADINFVLDYFRLSADHRLLFGGRVSYSRLDPLNLADTMGKRLRHVFPQLQGVKQQYTWGGYVGITMNRAPHFGRLDGNVYFAQGFSGHGIALTGMAGTLMADAIAGSAERFDLFGRIPHQDFPGGRLLRTPALVLAMAWYRLRDLL
ncbi:FAD-dependent oxidoreductase [Zobellella denitrificans]|jgi:gamma-glutamylputrescine oxidase|uniref:FAD-dependent oxidoreductase n=1 Tax=Zobellella denitrificans TaxID=347534 RepID=A0A231MW68_9GAMM|nr:FAD-binding oxidoreductase [Zobellella denitrificans]ATG74370.1 FAD-dependent oxidoreductase [Zobellella denitrificans]OXS14279.1 FAD-dependent oxidoreductase [Zobellella denitrificans]